ncbi:MAG: GntR family transcriptional regulator [Anaerolineales bacterium]
MVTSYDSSTNARSPSQRLHETLGKMIATAEAGERLPSEPKLARKLGVSRATLREAMRTFETQGFIRRRQGVGTFVVRPVHVIESGLEVLESIESVAARLGLPVKMGELKVERRQAKRNEAQALELDDDLVVISLSRVILEEDRPVAYFIDTLPEELLTEEEVARGFSGSVLEVLLRRGDPPLINSRCEISAVGASANIARALNIQRGDALLRFISRLYSLSGNVVDYSTSYFVPGHFRFHVIRDLA